ncbi:hypothetical protein B0T10DRAFT_572353 [Thelonectria olida]|uniref:Zn(2)-C6 fungal-type domain-containing protein n=1 Tax=Thelonectria olida TaxID=1576542 RepID=A0A9P8VQY0_9HYPO|nr:hypothetical protein B0T10DRAFT_572353 [Thelonectria olida]
MAASNATQPARKRTKRQDTRCPEGGGELDPELQQLANENSGSLAPSTRTGLACEACRLRKTRCVGFPTCTWCQQRRHPCVRGQNSQTSPAKNEILSASSGSSTDQSLNHASAALPSSSNSTDQSSQQRSTWTRARGGEDCFLPIPSAESILEWDILKAQLPNPVQNPTSATDAYEPDRSIHSKASADTSANTLQRLRQRFEQQFLDRYPIISRPWLARCIRDVAENDGGWTAEACLVFLVCALASLCDCPTTDSTALTPQTISRSPSSVVSPAIPGVPASRLLAYQYWTMAKRRLGWALDAPAGLLTAQCLCLAGFWHLQNCAPRRARNMFHRAVESSSNREFCSSMMDEERPLARLIHLLCADLFQ